MGEVKCSFISVQDKESCWCVVRKSILVGVSTGTNVRSCLVYTITKKYICVFFSEVPEIPETALQCETIAWSFSSPGSEPDILAHCTWYDPTQNEERSRGIEPTESL